MNNRTLLIACIITYILFVLLIFTEPIGYNPIWLSIFFFFVFALLYLAVTNTFMQIFEKFPKKLKKVLRIFSTIIELVCVFLSGWQLHNILNSGTSFFKDYSFIGLIIVISIIIVRKRYRNFSKD